MFASLTSYSHLRDDQSPGTDIDATTETTENAEMVKPGIRSLPSVKSVHSVVQYRVWGSRDVLTQEGRGLEYIRERRCARCATFPIGEYIILYETDHTDRISRLSA